MATYSGYIYTIKSVIFTLSHRAHHCQGFCGNNAGAGLAYPLLILYSRLSWPILLSPDGLNGCGADMLGSNKVLDDEGCDNIYIECQGALGKNNLTVDKS